ncbi:MULTISPECIES: hypothetical protein [unclassified Pseudoalteromonas]|uniref:hypothetical protein n=1 Tax=unclassified Pseudoalteromonas TaxID=194690 RepID=UPI001023CC36|nr:MULTISPECIES: hypothetical protein [unclassified Pseudoalteromonas]MCG7540416.1 hypothetical protein [Pseudoalteromonas sp. OF7H-1]RZG16836.1 hypothetical protein EXT47_05800 [Pseudoalteromonas sp. CO342X]
MSLAKHTLDLSLTDKVWFKYVTLKNKNELNDNSQVSLKSIAALGMLSGGTEFLFALLVFALAVTASFIDGEYPRYIAFPACLIAFLIIFFTKRAMLYKKFGFGSQWVMDVSKNQLTISPKAIKTKVTGTQKIAREDITEITFHYLLLKDRKGGRIKTTANLCFAEILLKDGTKVELNGTRVGFFDLLYLLIFFDYPLVYRNTSAGGSSDIAIILLRLLSLSAIAAGLAKLVLN